MHNCCCCMLFYGQSHCCCCLCLLLCSTWSFLHDIGHTSLSVIVVDIGLAGMMCVCSNVQYACVRWSWVGFSCQLSPPHFYGCATHTVTACSELHLLCRHHHRSMLNCRQMVTRLQYYNFQISVMYILPHISRSHIIHTTHNTNQTNVCMKLCDVVKGNRCTKDCNFFFSRTTNLSVARCNTRDACAIVNDSRTYNIGRLLTLHDCRLPLERRSEQCGHMNKKYRSYISHIRFFFVYFLGTGKWHRTTPSQGC